MKCPSCGSKKCNYVSSTQTDHQGFGSLDACCGFILLGPIGLLCGFCGSGSSTKVNEYWICQKCGNKFSIKEANRYMEKNGEEEKPKKLCFYLENEDNVLDSDTRRWKQIQTGMKQALEGEKLLDAVVTKNPAYSNEKFLKTMKEFYDVVSKKNLVFLVITEGEGIVITNEGILLKDHLIPFTESLAIAQYREYVYINQSSVWLSSQYNAKKIYQFLNIAFEGNSTNVENTFYSYEDLLEKLQKHSGEVNTSETHFSTQKEYSDYLDELMYKYLRRYQEVNPKRYAEYEKIKNQKAMSKKRIRVTWFIIAIISMIILTAGGGFFGFVFWIIIFGIIPYVNLNSYFSGESWNGYEKEYLRAEICELMVEIGRTSREKKGDIQPRRYKEIIASMNNEKLIEEKSFCFQCGKKLEIKWRSCPYCGSDKK